MYRDTSMRTSHVNPMESTRILKVGWHSLSRWNREPSKHEELETKLACPATGFLGIAEGFHNSKDMARMRTIERAAVMNKTKRPSMARASVYFHDESIHRPEGEDDDPVHVHIYSIVTIDQGKVSAELFAQTSPC